MRGVPYSQYRRPTTAILRRRLRPSETPAGYSVDFVIGEQLGSHDLLLIDLVMRFTALLYKWANRAQARGISPGAVQNSRGLSGGTTTESTRWFAIAPPAVPENQCIIRRMWDNECRFIRPRINEEISRIQGY